MELVAAGVLVIVAFFAGSWGGRQAPMRALASQLEELLIAAHRFKIDGLDNTAVPILARMNELLGHCVAAGLTTEEVVRAVLARGRVSQGDAADIIGWMNRHS
jgi:hypothetical protein